MYQAHRVLTTHLQVSQASLVTYPQEAAIEFPFEVLPLEVAQRASYSFGYPKNVFRPG